MLQGRAVMNDQERVATKHLFEYFDARPGNLLVAYERPYARLAACLLRHADDTGRPIRIVAAEEVSASELYDLLTEAQKFVCALNPTFEIGFSASAQIMTERSTTRSLNAYTLRDVSHVWQQLFQVEPASIRRLNQQLIRTLQDGATLNIRDGNGTDLNIGLSSDFCWVNMDGFTDADFDLTCNLPVGEVATYSADVTGVLRFTGALLGTIPIGRKYGRIDLPITVELKRGKIIALSCANSALQRDLEFCLYLDTYTDCVNEVAFGTHPAIRGPLYGLNYKYEENQYGFHLGFGASLAQQNVARRTPHHMDFVFDHAFATLDDRVLFDGEFHLDNFSPDPAAPLRTAQRSCCGFAADPQIA
jgi:leucyl aminopeptidase (aminopeptidase T)